MVVFLAQITLNARTFNCPYDSVEFLFLQVLSLLEKGWCYN